MPEFLLITRKHGMTPIEYAAELGLLGPGTILGHAIFIDEHSWLHWSTRRDLGLIADSGSAVAHCPTPFSRYGQTLEDLGRYIRAGVTHGHRHRLLAAQHAGGDALGRDPRARHGGLPRDGLDGRRLPRRNGRRRDGLGPRRPRRLAPGAKADIVVVDLADVTMQPARDPLRSLIYTAAERAVRDVYIDGRQVVADGTVLTLDRAAAAGRLAEAQARMLSATPQHDWKGRGAEEVSPLSLPVG